MDEGTAEVVVEETCGAAWARAAVAGNTTVVVAVTVAVAEEEDASLAGHRTPCEARVTMKGKDTRRLCTKSANERPSLPSVAQRKRNDWSHRPQRQSYRPTAAAVHPSTAPRATRPLLRMAVVAAAVVEEEAGEGVVVAVVLVEEYAVVVPPTHEAPEPLSSSS